MYNCESHDGKRQQPCALPSLVGGRVSVPRYFARETFEQRDGSCRLMASLCEQLAETAETWGTEVAPIVEWFAHALSMSSSGKELVRAPGTRLTNPNRFAGKGGETPAPKQAKKQQGVCSECGGVAAANAQLCGNCARNESGRRLSAVSALGRIAASTPEALQRISERMKQQREAISRWNPADLPSWLTDEYFSTKIWPALGNIPKKRIAEAIGVSTDYAYQLVNGNRVPHRRHWVRLAELVGIKLDEISIKH